MARTDMRRAQQPSPPRLGQGSAVTSRQRSKGRAATWIAVAALIAVLLTGGAFGARAVLARHSQTRSGNTAPQPTAEKSMKASAPTPVSTASAKAAPVQVANPAWDQAVPVLMYHHIMPVPNNTIAISPSTFDAQMKYLHDNGWHPVSISQLDAFVQTGERLPSKPVLITFDDDRMNQLTYGVPILKKYGFTATFFVVKKWIVSTSPSFMHVPELKQLIADGYDVQSHTTNHIQIHPARSRSTGQMETYAMMKSRYWAATYGMRTWMASALGGPPVIALAYPGGRFNTEADELAHDAGYDLAFTTNDGYVTYKGISAYELPRWNTGARGTTLATFVSILNGAEHYKRAK